MRRFGFLAWLFVLVAAPASAGTPAHAPQPQQLQYLEQRLAGLAIENPGEYGIAAMDLETRRHRQLQRRPRLPDGEHDEDRRRRRVPEPRSTPAGAASTTSSPA